jgi:hypothetical protein
MAWRAVSTIYAKLPNKPFGQYRSGQTLCDYKRIISQRREEFAQHLWLMRMRCHSLHLGLKVAASDWPVPAICEKLRIAEIRFHLSLNLCLRHNRIE